MLKRLRGDERGAVLVTAVLASAIVLLLSISAVSVAIHNTNESGYDRGRLQAIGAAEAGVDAYYSMLNTTQFTSANLISVTGSSSCVLTKTLSATPSVTVTVTPTYYTDSSGGNPASSVRVATTSGVYFQRQRTPRLNAMPAASTARRGFAWRAMPTAQSTRQ